MADVQRGPVVEALVLTFDDHHRLARCLENLQRQTRPPDRIRVIDNASPEEVPVLWDSSIPVQVERLFRNTGPAGGHAAGLEAFLMTDSDVAWVMDDDCLPDQACLATMLDEWRPQEILFPRWIERSTGAVRLEPAWNGFLIGRASVGRLGVPRADLFWWVEDTEYLQHRPRAVGIPTRFSKRAVVVHDQATRGEDKPGWKIYYEVRNTVWYRTRVQGLTAERTWKLTRSLVKLALMSARLGEGRLFAKGLLDGVRGRLGATIVPSSRSSRVQ